MQVAKAIVAMQAVLAMQVAKATPEYQHIQRLFLALLVKHQPAYQERLHLNLQMCTVSKILALLETGLLTIL